MPCTAIWFLNALYAMLIAFLLLCNCRLPLTALSMDMTFSLCAVVNESCWEYIGKQELCSDLPVCQA